MSYKRGDVVLVVFHPPTSGLQRETKSRPMVVLSSATYHAELPQDVIASLITSKISRTHGL